MLFPDIEHEMNNDTTGTFFPSSFSPTLIASYAYILLIVVGLAGNLWVTWKVGLVLLFSRPPIQQVTAGTMPVAPRSLLQCILVICVADFVVLATLSLLVDNLMVGQWRNGLVLCKVFYGVEVLNKFVIPLALVQISRISYAAAASASPKAAIKRRPLFMINLMTIITFLLLLACVLSFSNVETIQLPSKRKDVCMFIPPPAYGFLFNGAAFVVGYVLTVLYVYFYVSVPLVLKRRSSQSSTRALMRLNNSSIGRIRRIVVSFVLIYLICWTPYWIVFWLTSLMELPSWVVNLSLYAHMLPYASCAAYPVMLTYINDGIHIAHTHVLNRKKKQLGTIREGVVQVLSQMTTFQSAAATGRRGAVVTVVVTDSAASSSSCGDAV
ncbi:npr-30 [Pristionchus pacificus]|uniref:Npr-30 n=1 Tax=Pristionchus pacificus TaxID=54126 RepID=A0A2A6C958_PRIPA|nr:npr-30 [Pristionchus pacificus]|eukprot:PDM74755.1 npr-30 [Pristionchus pacificus]